MTTPPTAPTGHPPPRPTRHHHPAELRCDFCAWPAAWIAPESGALVCDPYTHPITRPEHAHPLATGQHYAQDDPADLDALLAAAGIT
jgi:hypothetical protein